MSEPLVVSRLREFKAQLLRREAGQMQQMARRWLDVEKSLKAEIDILAQAVADTPTLAKELQLSRLRSLSVQVQEEFNRYVSYCNGTMIEWQREMAELGIDHAFTAINTAAYPNRVSFSRLPVSATENMIGLAGNGQPIGKLLFDRMIMDELGNPLPGVLERLQQTLVNATAQGWNPTKTAYAMRNDLTAGLQKAMVIARTEQLRVYREASRMQYQSSGIVTGHKRLTAHDQRVCAACLADEGTVYPLSMNIPDHPNGRCTSVPVLRGEEEPQWLGGEDWLAQQDEATQRSILGPGHYDAWKGGVPLKDMLQRTSHPVWGDGVGVKPLGGMGWTGKAGTITPLNIEQQTQRLMQSVEEFIGVRPDVSRFEILPASEFDMRFTSSSDRLTGGVAAIRLPDGSIFVKQGFESDGLHELIHASGFLEDGVSTFVNEGMTQSATEMLAQRMGLDIRKTYQEEVGFVDRYLIPATEHKPVSVFRGYAAAEDKGEYLTKLIWDKHGAEFSDVGDWGVSPRAGLLDELRRGIGSGSFVHIRYLVDEVGVVAR